MGFFDETCMVTGVSLKPVPTTAVILRRHPSGAEHPISLTIHGTYDRLGGVDGVTEGPALEVLVDYFVAAARERRFDTGGRADMVAIENNEYSIDYTLEHIFRALNDSNLDVQGSVAPSVLLDAGQITSALIATSVWKSLAEKVSDLGTESDDVSQALSAYPDLARIYQPRLGQFAGELRELHSVGRALADRGLKWASLHTHDQRFPSEGTQHWDAEIAGWLAHARQVYRDDPAVLAALDIYRADCNAYDERIFGVA